jgi:hypoxanthine phosphoribosyltransferase
LLVDDLPDIGQILAEAVAHLKRLRPAEIKTADSARKILK